MKHASTPKAAAKSTTRRSGSTPAADPLAVSVILGDLLDTTWRIAVPVVAAAAVGILADRQLATGPVLTIVMSVFGFIAATVLVKRQLKAAGQEDKR